MCCFQSLAQPQHSIHELFHPPARILNHVGGGKGVILCCCKASMTMARLKGPGPLQKPASETQPNHPLVAKGSAVDSPPAECEGWFAALPLSEPVVRDATSSKTGPSHGKSSPLCMDGSYQGRQCVEPRESYKTGMPSRSL